MYVQVSLLSNLRTKVKIEEKMPCKIYWQAIKVVTHANFEITWLIDWESCTTQKKIKRGGKIALETPGNDDESGCKNKKDKTKR